MTKRYSEEVQWKINLAWDEQVLDKLKQAQRVKAQNQEKAQKLEGDAFAVQQIVATMRRNQERLTSNAL